MLGQFLEVALVTQDTGEAWQQLQQSGFEPASTGDIWPHAYGVMTCEGVAIGLHAQGDDDISLVFVRPEVAALHRELGTRRIEVETARLGSDVFNELTLREPGGVALRVLEARSFSPPSRIPARTRLGRFVALSLPSRDIEATGEFWRSLGYSTAESETSLEGFAIKDTPLACHPRQAMREPVMVFRGDGSDSDTLDAAALGIRLLLLP